MGDITCKKIGNIRGVASIEGDSLASIEGGSLASIDGDSLASIEGDSLASIEGDSLASIEGDSLLVFYCLSVTEIRPNKRDGKSGLIKRGLLYYIEFCNNCNINK
jgi:hypothetical protein